MLDMVKSMLNLMHSINNA